MELSKRLYTIANQVPKGAVVADIGTDHGYVPIFLYKKEIVKRAIATDINTGPLIRAKKNIEKYHGEQIIETRLGNGLEPIKPDEIDTVILAGMGGMLIIDILDKSLDVVKGVKRIILQPQLDQQEVRKYLHKVDFKIVYEEIIYEDHKYYWIITAEPGKEEYNSISSYLFGKILIENKNPVLKSYVEEKLTELRKILSHLNENNTSNVLERINEVKEEIKIHKEVLECL